MKLSEISKKMTLVISVLALILVVASIIYYRSLDFIPFAIGVILGSALNVFKLVMVERVVDKSLELELSTVSNYVRLQYLLRLLLTGVLLVIAATTPFVSLWGMAAGIFTLQIAAWSLGFQIKMFNKLDDAQK